MYKYTQASDAAQSFLAGYRANFNVVPIKANREGLQMIHDTFLHNVQQELGSVHGLIASLAFIPVTKKFLTASRLNGADPMDVDISGAPYIYAEESILWSDASDDLKVSNFMKKLNADVSANLSTLHNVMSPFLYLNYANQEQHANVKKMQSIRDKYDPNMVFTELISGSWKVAKAFTGGNEA
ncbi:hypothetical protein N7453_001750 [Penicillium expansum]|nr:hypothetical protein N7453_001750 [Penicillium expansum]